MRTRILGRTGVRVSEVGFGGAPAGISNYAHEWNPAALESEAQVTAAVHRAIDLGYTVFDTAPAYGAGRGEELFGRALAGHRAKVFLATKAGWRDEDYERSIPASLDASLRRLGTDWVDLLQIHGNYEDCYDATDVERILNGGVLACYERAREQGKARFLGITSEYPHTLIPLIQSGRFDVVQLKYNLLYQEPYHHVLPLCDQMNVGVLVMRSNTSGILGKYVRAIGGSAPSDVDVNAVALNYVLSDARVHCALVGMRSILSVDSNSQISDNVAIRVDLDWLHERRADIVQPDWRSPKA